jgi:hypothetical protein
MATIDITGENFEETITDNDIVLRTSGPTGVDRARVRPV